MGPDANARDAVDARAPRTGGRPRVGRARDIQLAAIELLSEHGYSSMNVENVAAELGIGRTTVFRYFGSKSGLVWSDYDQQLTNLEAELAASSPTESIVAAIRRCMLATTTPAPDERRLWRSRFALITTTPELEPERARIVAKFAETIASFVRSRANISAHPVIPEALGYALAGAASAVTRTWATAPAGTSFDEVFASALDAVLAPFATILDDSPPVSAPAQ